MHILFVHCGAHIAYRYAIHRCNACRIVHNWLVSIQELGLHCGFVLCVRPCFTPVVTHVSPYPFSALLSDPCPAVVLVSNGLERRSPRTREIWSIRHSDPTREPC